MLSRLLTASYRARSVACAVIWRRGALRPALLVVLAVVLVAAPACSLRHHTVANRKGTLTVTPPSGAVGASFSLAASGFLPGEALTFEIDVPNKTKFVGPSHTANPQGMVSSTYVPQTGDPSGVYTVIAAGNEGTRAQANLTVTG
ncbi:MAG TPA: hypothetical protein VHT30_11095 [Acidimicrobiales bacterium]|jgi:hypothetical protein|nr:hypothetical protein [Acidimicrobiales bacterium]